MGALATYLEPCVPKGMQLKALHLQTYCLESKNLLIYPPGSVKPLKTYKVKHFFTLSTQEDVLLFGIEIYNYITIFEDHTENLFFIGKADTTGFKSLKSLNIKIGEITEGYLKYLLSLDITKRHTKKIINKNKQSHKMAMHNLHLYSPSVQALYKAIEMLKDEKNNESYYKLLTSKPRENVQVTGRFEPISIQGFVKTRVCLFTRPERQYLFPDSYKNLDKHIIDGKTLLKWWLTVVNNTIKSIGGNWNCKLAIPGTDIEAVSSFYKELGFNWSHGSIFTDKTADDNKKAIHYIPLFPDDPKGRFLEHLVVENRHNKTNVKEYWQELGIRQEFRLGILVGIIGCEANHINSHDHNTPLKELTLSNYKKFVGNIKEQEYVLENCNQVTRAIKAKIEELGLEQEILNGQKTEPFQNSAEKVLVRKPINNLTGMIKRKKK